MTTYYVRKTGNDLTGDGSTGNPWLTVNKAATTVPLAGGDTVKIGAGTYEEDSGAGYLQFSRAFVSTVIFESESGNPADVTISNVSGVIAALYFLAFAKVTLRNLTLTNQANTCPYVVRSVRGSYLTLENCLINVKSRAAGTNYGVHLSPSSAQTIEHVVINGCTITQTGTDSVVGVFATRASLTRFVDDVQVLNCTITTKSDCVQFVSGTNLLLDDGVYVNTTGHGVMVGFESTSGGLEATGAIVRNATISSTNGHALLLGEGATNSSATSNVITGGDYGLVIKECDNATVIGNMITGGTVGGLFVKGATNPTIQNNTISVVVGDAVLVNINDSTLQKALNVELTRNQIRVSGTADLFNWAGVAGDDGGGICDYNTYSLSSSGDFGDVRATSNIANLAALRVAWVGYDVAGNDVHSQMAGSAFLGMQTLLHPIRL